MNRLLRHVALFAYYGFFYLPLVVLVLYAFNQSPYSLVWHGFTTHWFNLLLSDKSLWVTAYHSFILALGAATCSTLLGTLGAMALYRYRFFGRHAFYGMVLALILAPDLVMGIAWLILFNHFHIPLGFWSLLLAHITISMPFVLMTVYGNLRKTDKHLLEAGQDLGAQEWQLFTKILLPLLWAPILAGWLLSFTLSLDDVIVSYFLAGPSFDILPLRIFAMVKTGIKPEINALSSIILLLTLFMIFIAETLMRKRP